MAAINPGRKALQAYLMDKVDPESPLMDEEFDFLLASIRNVGKDAILKDKERKSLGFNQSQINRYQFEVKKHKLKWPYEVDSGKLLKNKPKGFEKFIQEMVAIGLEEQVPRYRAALPIDWKMELQKFDSMSTYDEFWNHLISLHSNPALSGSYEKQIKHHGLNRWIKIINSLDYPDAFTSNYEDRYAAFSAISSLSEFLPSISTERESIENPLFFLQYTRSEEDFIHNLVHVRNLKQFNSSDQLTLIDLLERQIFNPWRNELNDKFKSTKKTTADDEIKHRAAIKRSITLRTKLNKMPSLCMKKE